MLLLRFTFGLSLIPAMFAVVGAFDPGAAGQIIRAAVALI